MACDMKHFANGRSRLRKIMVKKKKKIDIFLRIQSEMHTLQACFEKHEFEYDWVKKISIDFIKRLHG